MDIERKTRYEYDRVCRVLIKCVPGKSPQIIDDTNLVWRGFGPEDEAYEEAIYVGQGCWEDLDTIDEETANRILTSWGYTFPEETV